MTVRGPLDPCCDVGTNRVYTGSLLNHGQGSEVLWGLSLQTSEARMGIPSHVPGLVSLPLALYYSVPRQGSCHPPRKWQMLHPRVGHRKREKVW